jgi:hypothetical protein
MLADAVRGTTALTIVLPEIFFSLQELSQLFRRTPSHEAQQTKGVEKQK